MIAQAPKGPTTTHLISLLRKQARRKVLCSKMRLRLRHDIVAGEAVPQAPGRSSAGSTEIIEAGSFPPGQFYFMA